MVMVDARHVDHKETVVGFIPGVKRAAGRPGVVVRRSPGSSEVAGETPARRGGAADEEMCSV